GCKEKSALVEGRVRGGPETGIEIFDLCRPVGSEGPFDAAADRSACPRGAEAADMAILQAAHERTTIGEVPAEAFRCVDLGERHAARHVEQQPINGEAHASADRREPLHVDGVDGSNRASGYRLDEVAGVAAGLEVGE